MIRRIGALVVTAVMLYVLLPSLARVVGAWPELASLSGVWLAISLLSEATSFTCTFGIQRIVLRTRGWFAVVTAGLVGNAVTDTLPGGAATGAAVQFQMLSAAGVETDTAAGGLTASSLLSIGGLLALPVLTLPAVLGSSGVNHTLALAAAAGVVGFVIYAGVCALLLSTDRPLLVAGDAVQWLWNKLRRRHPHLTLIIHEAA
jgi:hypothetical protein